MQASHSAFDAVVHTPQQHFVILSQVFILKHVNLSCVTFNFQKHLVHVGHQHLPVTLQAAGLRHGTVVFQ
ncbi:hypothetical protein CRENBAI_002867 [Crenichthys baileyi]|uniref:Uncharacterized protein n=1 Tax=Crenichthys baileyi TaxID=28760 RepID=A0AAV9R9K6_9TELE